MPLTNSTPETPDRLKVEWRDATMALSQAQTRYSELIAGDVEDDAAVSAAWLRLYRAQERHRQLIREDDSPAL